MVQVTPLNRGGRYWPLLHAVKSIGGGNKNNKNNKFNLVYLVWLVLGLYLTFSFYTLATARSDGDVVDSSSSHAADHSNSHRLEEQLSKPKKINFEEQAKQRLSSGSHVQATNNDNNNVLTVGFAVSVTGCGSDPITEGAAVLKHSIHLASIHGMGKYDYKMYAIYHPNALKCASPLKDLGYTLLERNTPVAVKDIEGEFLRTKIEQNGCCGEKELIKLEAYTLVEHPIVVHLDLDVLVVKPLDDLFDAMTHGDISGVQKDIMWENVPLPKKINAFFTRDYNMVNPKKKYKPVQGGFLVLRPDMEVYNEFVSIVKKGDFRSGSGWGGIGGVFYGSMTFQGIIPYFYDILHPGNDEKGGAVELNRCVYNQMCDNPRDQKTVNDVVHGDCRTGQPNEICEDCRSRPLEDVVTTHFTLCQKPWLCLPHTQDMIQHRLCRKLHHEWFRIRSDLEKSWGRSGMGPYTKDQEHFYGYCDTRKYDYIAKPYYPNMSSNSGGGGGATDIERR